MPTQQNYIPITLVSYSSVLTSINYLIG